MKELFIKVTPTEKNPDYNKIENVLNKICGDYSIDYYYSYSEGAYIIRAIGCLKSWGQYKNMINVNKIYINNTIKSLVSCNIVFIQTTNIYKYLISE